MTEHEILAGISTEALRQELLRRAGEARPRRGVVYCDVCEHFRKLRDGENDEGYNPCRRGHALEFRLPRNGYDSAEGWGYFRVGCRDRKRRREWVELGPRDWEIREAE